MKIKNEACNHPLILRWDRVCADIIIPLATRDSSNHNGRLIHQVTLRLRRTTDQPIPYKWCIINRCYLSYRDELCVLKRLALLYWDRSSGRAGSRAVIGRFHIVISAIWWQTLELHTFLCIYPHEKACLDSLFFNYSWCFLHCCSRTQDVLIVTRQMK